eukprot:scaffold277621_cov22-Prasinocladus_malaysianus.AAC.1
MSSRAWFKMLQAVLATFGLMLGLWPLARAPQALPIAPIAYPHLQVKENKDNTFVSANLSRPPDHSHCRRMALALLG